MGRTKRERIADRMRHLISSEHWRIGQSLGDLWSLQEHSEELFGERASWGTIRAAEGVLAAEGLLSTIQGGVPTRVIAVPPRPELNAVAELRVLHARLGEVYSQLGDLIARAAAEGGGVAPALPA
jgi:DNA-binding FadR family transcriptional regulator